TVGRLDREVEAVQTGLAKSLPRRKQRKRVYENVPLRAAGYHFPIGVRVIFLHGRSVAKDG
ncbi:MAG TPA: hypothetical protein VHV10_01210, partial [Ktedonobacteraceae bacterium]|nr:hypothetical protein [Ktedonobacteraceae bacterium]